MQVIYYKIFPELNLIALRLAGDCYFSALMACIRAYMQDPAYQPTLNGVLDMRDGRLVLTPEEILQISSFVHQQKFAKGRWCHLVEHPRSTALGTLYQNLIQDEHPLKVFSTLEAASSFLLTDLGQVLPQRPGTGEPWATPKKSL